MSNVATTEAGARDREPLRIDPDSRSVPCAVGDGTIAGVNFVFSHAGFTRRASFPARVLHGPVIAQAHGRHDEGEMRERLGKIAELPPRLRIVFFREQADIVA